MVWGHATSLIDALVLFACNCVETGCAGAVSNGVSLISWYREID